MDNPLLDHSARKDALEILALIFAGEERATDARLAVIDDETREKISEALEIAANIFNGHDCRVH